MFEDIDLKFCIHIHQTLPSNIMYVFFENFDFEEKFFEKKKWIFLKFFEIFTILKIRDSCFVALLLLRYII